MSKKVYLAGGFYGPQYGKIGDEKSTLNQFPKESSEVFVSTGVMKIVDWQTHVIEWCEEFGFEFFNPKNKFSGYTGNIAEDLLFSQPRNYTSWDMQKIRESDIVFAYIDSENPGVGVIAEVGYAKGLGKFVILVVETPHKVHKHHHFNFIREMSDVHFDNIDEGILFLKSL